MADICNDDRFEMIKRVKERLVKGTNIETRPEEMAVVDSILFRFWQMGWLKLIDESFVEPSERRLYCFDYIPEKTPFLGDGKINIRHERVSTYEAFQSCLGLIRKFAKINSLYIGNLLQGKIEDLEAPKWLDDDDWASDEWLNKLKK